MNLFHEALPNFLANVGYGVLVFLAMAADRWWKNRGSRDDSPE
ncbi:hypothetical protein [Streptomyces virginiae]|nr:hypothetical protein [Streptomyces virginiae]MCX5278425.1 hypothetical protein [Streptomyces virginiae]